MFTSQTPSRALLKTSALIATVLVASACNRDADAAQSQPSAVNAVPVTVATATSGTASQSVTASGTFGSRDEIPLSFKIGGVIASVQVDAGASVRKGQILAALDLREIDAMVSKARVAVDKAERDAARLSRLAADSVATRAQSQDAASALDAARADLTSARVNREYATIVAPEDGIVLRRNATPGTTINPGSPVLMLGGTERGRVLRVGLPDRDALRVRVGDSATVTFDAQPGRTWRGSIALLGKAADSRTGTYTAEIRLAGTQSLPSGLFGRADIDVRDAAVATMVPVDALVEADADSATVFTLSSAEPRTAIANRVYITRLAGANAAVTGVEVGAQVITRGAGYVRHNGPVRVTTTEATRAAGGAQ